MFHICVRFADGRTSVGDRDDSLMAHTEARAEMRLHQPPGAAAEVQGLKPK